ncbi:DUF2332 family protein, partial [Bradyrhizobium sp. NBAIM08]|uniref:DUF2332 family protein n=1 Tax=Bradyrhizobium sp. NBAIM08 TaxID=2793815 RepID=UPI001CD33DC6
GMPPALRTALLGELRLDAGTELPPLGDDEVFEVDGPLDLTMLREIVGLPIPELRFPPAIPRMAFIPDRSVFSIIRERDQLVHHPYDDFASSVPMYADLARRIANDDELLALLGHAPAEQRLPVLLFASVHSLVLADPTVALGQYYASVNADPRHDSA